MQVLQPWLAILQWVRHLWDCSNGFIGSFAGLPNSEELHNGEIFCLYVLALKFFAIRCSKFGAQTQCFIVTTFLKKLSTKMTKHVLFLSRDLQLSPVSYSVFSLVWASWVSFSSVKTIKLESKIENTYLGFKKIVWSNINSHLLRCWTARGLVWGSLGLVPPRLRLVSLFFALKVPLYWK